MIEMEVSKTLQAADGPMELQISMHLEQGQFATLYGPSGAGKTSTLRILAGLMPADKGRVVVNGSCWFDADSQVNLPPQQRSIGFVFQDYALFPHMSVLENLQYALANKDNLAVLKRLMDITELNGLKDQKPTQLSGGQQQRVALARALVQQPKLLLLDEPLSALDLETRQKLQDYLLEIHREFGLTTLLISHDLGEILKLSDQVFVLDKGKIGQQGTPQEIFAPKQVSGKFQFSGKILKIERQEVVYVVTVVIQNQLIKVIAGPADIDGLAIGDTVLVASKAFNPILYKVR